MSKVLCVWFEVVNRGAGDTWAAPIGRRSLTSVMLASFFFRLRDLCHGVNFEGYV